VTSLGKNPESPGSDGASPYLSLVTVPLVFQWVRAASD
jgi:hypothetical protein